MSSAEESYHSHSERSRSGPSKNSYPTSGVVVIIDSCMVDAAAYQMRVSCESEERNDPGILPAGTARVAGGWLGSDSNRKPTTSMGTCAGSSTYLATYHCPFDNVSSPVSPGLMVRKKPGKSLTGSALAPDLV